ncbi:MULTISPECIES: CRISPR-associated endoribonuclease Cas6 [unclassified Crossiella]|uniref:CRISPR-associated endoribonuclease Cas6 n=1 Tax=unclassified Crossiella TaxID=2620835 RepID=UPI001FFECF2F|nr:MULTISPECIES: CRISPR-associated endoribonuclease Cas6 [unclassified Crossiella]MCK2245193.1 CRISPR-associated protein Cas6 [Crossiella sp. S99.2]MCK2258885.1 CRISPR-associated protein Cas6 [Crossiella sp. S99.1]
MRLRCQVFTRAQQIPWDALMPKGRGVFYDALRDIDPALAQQLHDIGIGPRGLTPLGYCPPRFDKAKTRGAGIYRAGGQGIVEVGSPLLHITQALAEGLTAQRIWDWGGVALQVGTITPVLPPRFATGTALMRSQTPVMLRSTARDESGQLRRNNYLLPGDPEWVPYLQINLQRKAEALDLDPDISVEEVTWIGARRRFTTSATGAKTGAPVEVRLSGAPATLQAIWSWGLGLSCSGGWGWVQA